MKIKILYITNEISGPGGLERVLSIKASYFADFKGYDVHILTLNRRNTELFYSFSEAITHHNIEVGGNPYAYLKKYRNGLKKTIGDLNPDVISVCDDGLKGLLLPYIIGKKKPMIYERHVSKNIEIKKNKIGLLNKFKTKLLFKLMDFGGSKYDKLIVLTPSNTKEWSLKNIQVIPNPLSFFPVPENQSNLKNKKVLAVGKQSYQKGYDRLLKSWEIVTTKHPDWSLDIYGTFSEHEGLVGLANSLGISNSLNFYPPVKNIADKYKEASIYVMSSRYEGFGMVLTEAMAYGVPCISFDCPHGPADIITNGEDGLLVTNGNIQAMATAINKLIDNPNQRTKMGEMARKNVQRFSIEQIALQWDNLFHALIKNK